MAAAQPAAFKRFSLGDFEITVLSDGHRVVPGPQEIFGTDKTEEEADKAKAAAPRKAVFAMIAADRLLFVGNHMPFPSAGFIETAAEGYRFIPETYQFEL
ncbi:hypothetical protein [Hoeflea alexandrii]|uniref:hypothetical protein n=1 Tax=Hoeflea alexandrii TaxID=288436 RepID=UPI003D2F9263